MNLFAHEYQIKAKSFLQSSQLLFIHFKLSNDESYSKVLRKQYNSVLRL